MKAPLSTRIIIATITLARNEEEAEVLKQSLQQLAALNIPVTIADGGSISSFIDFLKTISHFTLAPKTIKGLQAQANKSLQLADKASPSFILYTEPDKKDFFQYGLDKFLSTVEVKANTGIILASRSAAGLASFAPFQQMTENTINRCCEEVIGKQADYTYGPFLLHKNLVPHLRSLKEDIGWGWRPYLFTLAHRLGLTVDIHVDDYYCPAEQQADSSKERIYRMKQLEQNIRGIVLGSTLELSTN